MRINLKEYGFLLPALIWTTFFSCGSGSGGGGIGTIDSTTNIIHLPIKNGGSI
jgi:hypothetical protein